MSFYSLTNENLLKNLNAPEYITANIFNLSKFIVTNQKNVNFVLKTDKKIIGKINLNSLTCRYSSDKIIVF